MFAAKVTHCDGVLLR